MEEAHVSHLCPRSCTFSYPQFVSIGEGRNIDLPLSRELNSLHYNRLVLSPHYCGRSTSWELFTSYVHESYNKEGSSFYVCSYFFTFIKIYKQRLCSILVPLHFLFWGHKCVHTGNSVDAKYSTRTWMVHLKLWENWVWNAGHFTPSIVTILSTSQKWQDTHLLWLCSKRVWWSSIHFTWKREEIRSMTRKIGLILFGIWKRVGADPCNVVQ